MIAHGLHAVLSWLAPESAVKGYTEILQESECRAVAALQAGCSVHRENDAEKNMRIAHI